MLIDWINGRRYARFERLASIAGLKHAFATRPNDVSARTDSQSHVRDERRRTMAADLGFDSARLRYCVQAHRDGLAIIDDSTIGAAARGRVEDVDTIITALSDTPVMTFSADCPLILVFDPRRRVVGLAHSSWRCTVAFSTRRLIETMHDRFGCRPGELLAGIGPSAGPEQYEVKDDVYEAARVLPQHDRLFRRRDGRMFFDLWEANRRQLVQAGVADENVEVAGVCTMSESELFYSFRREGAGCGHFGLMAGVSG